ncbi:hypothetical protein DPEC_G00105170 [Dallia pectoralis]|uniref:Uncharacterized protein n=1 Tax=Dallia pectoralis TaxID=75939 RepID=A0ACC2GY88_DALPE|nr:hypothetical protein DPEC_G00105170 [Dallia pectoralis]
MTARDPTADRVCCCRTLLAPANNPSLESVMMPRALSQCPTFDCSRISSRLKEGSLWGSSVLFWTRCAAVLGSLQPVTGHALSRSGPHFEAHSPDHPGKDVSGL